MGVLDKILRAGEGKTLRKLEGIAKTVNSIESDFVDLTDMFLVCSPKTVAIAADSDLSLNGVDVPWALI